MIKAFIRNGIALASLALASGAAAPVSAKDPEILRFGLLPAEDSVDMVQQFQGAADHVGKQLGVRTSIVVAHSYNGLIEALAADKLDLAYVGAGAYVTAYLKGMPIVPVVVAKMEGKRAYYKSCIVTKRDSGLRSINDIKGKNFAFVAPTSTSGGVAPRYLLLKSGIDPEKDFAKLFYAGKHDASLLAVLHGKVDAAAVGDIYFPRWKERGILDYETWDDPNNTLVGGPLHVIDCISVPGTPLVGRKSLGVPYLKRVEDAFTSIPENLAEKVRFWGPTFGFIGTDHAFYEDFVKMKELEVELKKQGK